MSEALSKGEVTSTELTQAHLDRIAGVESSVKAFLHVDAEGALAQAARVDADRSAGKKLHPLAGIPLALKDVLTQEGIPTTAGSKILQGLGDEVIRVVKKEVNDVVNSSVWRVTYELPDQRPADAILNLLQK